MKKKRIGLLKLSLSLLFTLLFVNSFTTCNADSLLGYQINSSTMQTIIDGTNLGNVFSGDSIIEITTTYNTWARTMNARDGFSWDDVHPVFFRQDNRLAWILFNGGVSDISGTNKQIRSSTVLQSNTYTLSIGGTSGFTYDTNNNVNGITSATLYYYYFSSNNFSTVYSSNTTSTISGVVANSNNPISWTVNSAGNYLLIFPFWVCLTNSNTSFLDFPVLSNSSTGYHQFYLNYNFNNIPDPTPTGGGGGSEGGGGGTVIVNGGMTQEEFIQGQEDFWGNSDDITGDEQIDFASGEVLGLIDEFSGDLTSLGFFGVISQFEQKFEDIFNNHDENNLDFVISWDNVDISLFGFDYRIIPSGDINFSKYCRDFPILGTVQTTIRVIFNFFFGFNLLHYLYNLVLSTLGIDNPYLYENPEYFEEHILYDVNNGYTDEISTTTYHSRPHHTISMRKRGRYYND